MASSFDTRQFEAGLARWSREYQQNLVKAMGQAGMMLLNEAVMDAPTVPMETGDLRGSGSVFVNGKLTGTSENQGSGGSPARSVEYQARPGEVICHMGFNTVYAAVMHEGRWQTGPMAGVEIRNWSEPNSGKFFLSAKLAANGEKYVGVAVEEARRMTGM